MADRAIVFDLDDTLYALDRFVLSGFRAVAATVAADWRVDRTRALDTLVAASMTARGQELQALAAWAGREAAAVPALVEVMRTHEPDLCLPAPSVAVLDQMRGTWRIGVVTNGRPDIQARKARALGLSLYVDTVVFAHEHGAGKPDAAPFLAACRRLGVSPSRTVFVGDDPICDITGAGGVGMKTIWLAPHPRPTAADTVEADVTVATMAAVPDAADRLIAPEWRAHVA